MAASRPMHLSAWPDLPADLLGIVLRRLPSLADRVRLRAVCRQWRSSAATVLHQSPLQLRWLTFPDGTLLDVANNTAYRVRLPDDGATCYCAGKNMIFLFHTDGRCSLMNTFSGEVTPLPELTALLKSHDAKSSEILKVVMPSAPRLVAVLFGYSSIAFASYGPDGEVNSCRAVEADRCINIAIFQGEIHGISRDNKLLALELNNDDKQTPHMRQIVGGPSLPAFTASHGNCEVWQYLVESNGRLLMVIRWVSSHWLSKSAGRTNQLSVVEADLSHGQWKNADGLVGQALFVSRLCSKSVPAAAAGGDGAQQDCIYFLNEYNATMRASRLGDSGAYNIRDGTITPLVPEHTATSLPWNGQQARPAWFFPVEV